MRIINGWGQPWTRCNLNGKDWSTGILAGFDTETTSANPETARIVSAAIVIHHPHTGYVKTWEWLADPETDIELEATAIHGISTEEARTKGQNRSVVIKEITSTLSHLDYPLVMVNAPFDLTILRQEMKRLYWRVPLEDIKLPFIIDTLTCDRKLDPYRRGRRTLTATAAAYGITIQGAHQPVGDIMCSIRLAREMARRYPSFARCDLEFLQRLQAAAHEEWCEQYEAYRRIDDSVFMISRGWPWQTYGDDAA